MSLTFSIIIPSFNQPDYIEYTLMNVMELKQRALSSGVTIEVLLFDSCSNKDTQAVIEKYRSLFDVLVIKKDKGQYDAINQGILKCTGHYWTWLNTDDLLNLDGFFKLVEILKNNPAVDYIYGGVTYMDDKGSILKTIDAWDLTLDELITREPAIFQPGSFFKKSFTDQTGLLAPYACCFDYEYVVRCLKHGAVLYTCDFPVSLFRYYSNSKTGSNTVQFIEEQLVISRGYGRKWYHYLTAFSKLRLLKHFLFPRNKE